MEATIELSSKPLEHGQVPEVLPLGKGREVS